MRLRQYFANGDAIDPASVVPRLELVEPRTWQSDLFRMAALTWSVPVSQGYGRRMRFLVWDDASGHLMGLMGLGDPVFNLRPRDEWIGWSAADRKRRLVHTLDAFVLGAVAPYSFLLGSKAIAVLVRTREVRDAFRRRYGQTVGSISHRRKNARLVLVTTSSALGRSSVYNRLTLGDEPLFRRLGYSQGFGHFHIPRDDFALMREYLQSCDHAYARNFEYGDGPNWRMRAVRECLGRIGLNPALLRHGIRREVFGCTLARNAVAFLRGEAKTPKYADLFSAAEMGIMARERWMVARAARDKSYQSWTREQLLHSLSPRSELAELATVRGTGTDGPG